jgi:cytochrome c553
MSTLGRIAFLGVLCATGVAAAAESVPPPWAFAVDDPAKREPRNRPGDDQPRHVPGSAATLTRAQTLDLWNVPDWHPDDHPPAPDIVMHGRKPGGFSCGYCHYANGLGIPENASLAGLPADYILRQIEDYRSGARSTALPTMASFIGMKSVAVAISDADAKAAADYYAALKPKPWIKVVETETVPKTHVSNYVIVPDADGGTEPIGDRVLEVPADPAAFELHDSESGFIAYVPPGSIARGKKLAAMKTGGGPSCFSCHGPDLKGRKDAPPIAGRSPSNIGRQLYDIAHGANSSGAAQPMRLAIKKLTDKDIVDLTAYVASLSP